MLGGKISGMLMIFILLCAFFTVTASATSAPIYLQGNLMVDGKPAAVGTEVKVVVDGYIIGTTIVTKEGIFGDEQSNRLAVPSYFDVVSIYVNNVETQTLDLTGYASGDVVSLDITIEPFAFTNLLNNSSIELYNSSIEMGNGYQINNYVIDVTDVFVSANSASFYIYEKNTEINNVLLNTGESFEFDFEDGGKVKVTLLTVSSGIVPRAGVSIALSNYNYQSLYKNDIINGGHEYATYSYSSGSGGSGAILPVPYLYESRGNAAIDATSFTWNGSNFPAFWYDIDSGMYSETLTIERSSLNTRTIGSGNLEYITVSQTYPTEFNFTARGGMFDEYKMVGLFGNEYYVIADGKLSKILIDSDSRYTLRIGQTLQLADNYTIAPKQIDVDEGKVLVEIIKDGQFLEDVVIDVSPNNNTVYVYGQDIMGEEDVVTLMVNVDQVFQGQVDNLCIIEGIFQLSETGIEIQNDDRFGKLIVNEVTSDYITMENENSFSLPIDNTIHIAEDLYLRGNTNVGTGLGNDIFYLVKKYTDPGIYKVRGDAAEDVTEFTWNAINFPGFWYDIDSGTYSETMTITRNGLHSRYIGEGELIYNAEFKEDETNFDFNARSSYYPTVSSYHKIGLFGEQYFRIGQGKLSKILIDTDDAYVVKVGHDHELAEGYAFKPKEIDVTGEKVWVELTKDGQFIDDAIIDVASAEHTVFVYEQDIMGEEAVITLQINIHQLLKSQVDNFCIIEGIFQISDNVIDVGADDRFGNLIVHEVTSDYILMKNENSVNIPNDGTTHIAEGFYLRGNANVGLPIGPEIYYIFTEVTVEEIPVEPEEPADEPFVYSMSLQKGWNLVSIPIYPTESSTSSIFESYDDVIFPVYSWNAANKQYYEAESFEIGKGYWVMALNNTDVNIEGVPFTGQ